MPTTTQMNRVAYKDITVPEGRQRKDFKDIEELAQSIRRLGLINPIVITRDNVLVAGERRLRAWKINDEQDLLFGESNYTTIPVHYIDQLDSHELRIIELEENIQRTDLTWQEQAEAVRKIHQLFCEEDPNWTATATAERIGMHSATVSRYLSIIRESATNEKVLAAPTISSAVSMVRRAEERRAHNVDNVIKDITKSGLAALGITEEQRSEEPEILVRNAIEFMATYSGERFNLIHCDFPYGINFQDGWNNNTEQWGGYDDRPEVFWELLSALANFWDNIASPSCHLIFWFSMKYFPLLMEFIHEKIPALTINEFPLVWLKSDNRGTLPDPNRGPRRIYETALFGYTGDRKIIKAVGNAYAAPTQRSTSLHISEKPEPVLRHFFSMIVDENTTLFDPTCGSGSALRAAYSLGARRVLGVELNQEYAISAQKKLNEMKALREAEQNKQLLTSGG